MDQPSSPDPGAASAQESTETPSPTSSENFCWDINNPPKTTHQQPDESYPSATRTKSLQPTTSMETQTPDPLELEDAMSPTAQDRPTTDQEGSKSPSSFHQASHEQSAIPTEQVTAYTQTNKHQGLDKSTQTSGFYLIHT